MTTQTNAKLFAKAQRFIPGGVNSPVRAFKSVGAKPIFIERAKGAYLFDAEGPCSLATTLTFLIRQ